MKGNRLTLTVSIVLYKNDEKELMYTIESVLKSKGIDIKLYIIDNSPTDKLRGLFNNHSIEYIFNNSNLGFGAGHNVALRKAINESKYHLCLNPDITFGDDVLSKIVAYMDQHISVGQLLPKVLDNNGVLQAKQRRLLPTPYITFFRNIFKNLPYTKKTTANFFTRFKSYDQEMSSPFLSGCFVFLRTDTLKEVGIFDERFFMYYEDADLSRRIYSHTGNMYWPGVTITHTGHMGSHKNIKLAWIHIKSAVKYFNKWGWFENNRRRINQQVILENIQ